MLAYGTIGLEAQDKPLDLHLRLQDASIPLLLAAFDQADIPAAGVFGVVDVDGTVDDPRATIDLSGRDIAAYSESPGTLSVKGGTAARTFARDATSVDEEPSGTLQGTGSSTRRPRLIRSRHCSRFRREADGATGRQQDTGPTEPEREEVLALRINPRAGCSLKADDLNVDGTALGGATAR